MFFGDFFDPTVIFAGSFGVFSMVILSLLGLLFAVAAYVFPCYTLMSVGRKARQQSGQRAGIRGQDGMPYRRPAIGKMLELY